MELNAWMHASGLDLSLANTCRWLASAIVGVYLADARSYQGACEVKCGLATGCGSLWRGRRVRSSRR